MKRLLIVLLFAIALFLSCAFITERSETVKNNVFTDELFDDVVEISDSRFGQVSGKQMESIISFLKGMSLTAMDETLKFYDENGELLYGLDYLTLKKSDGTEIVFFRNHKAISNPDIGSYEVEGENLNSGLEKAFIQAEKYIDNTENWH